MATPTATPEEIRAALQTAIDKIAGEAAQANLVTRSLAALGHRSSPKVVSGRLEGDVIRLYQWTGTPAGTVILAAGPAFKGRIFQPSDISTAGSGIYVLASPDRSKAESRAAAYTESYKPRQAPSRSRVAPPAPMPRVSRERATRAASSVRARSEETRMPSAAATEASERAELTNALKALLG